MAFLRKELDDLKNRLVSTSATTIASLETHEVGLKDSHGVIHTFHRHTKQKWTDDRHRDSVIKSYVDRLRDKDVEPSYNNLEKLGFGRGTYTDYKNGRPVGNLSGTTNEKKQGSVKHQDTPEPDGDRALQSGGVSSVILPVGTKVISNTNPDQSENTIRQKLKRDNEFFGEQNVLENADDCKDGVILHGKRFKTDKGTTLIRDICEDER